MMGSGMAVMGLEWPEWGWNGHSGIRNGLDGFGSGCNGVGNGHDGIGNGHDQVGMAVMELEWP